MKFTTEDDNKIIELWRQGIGQKRIAKIMRTTPFQIGKRVEELDLTNHRRSQKGESFYFNWNPSSFSLEGMATKQAAIYRKGMAV